MSHRVERVEKIIERELANILFNDSKNDKFKFVSITKVGLSPDMSVATIWYTIIGNKGEIEATNAELLEAKGYLRSELARKIDLRRVPDLRFKYDESLAYGNHISSIIDSFNKK